MTKPLAPTVAIGYVNQSYGPSNNWWMYDPETTPELRWPQSVVVYDAMRTQDAQVGSVLEAVMRPVLRTPWRIDPAGARAEVVEFVADDLGLPIVGQNPDPPPRTKDRFSWLEHLELALLMLPYGHSFFEQIYRVDEGGDRAHLGKLEPRPARTIDRIEVARDGGLISITQCGTLNYGSLQKPIPVARLVAYVYKREGGNWLGRSILRQAYKNWLIKDRLLRVQAQTIERNGMGIPLYEDAENATPDQHAAGLAMAKAWRSGEAAGSAIPNGAKLSLVGVTGQLPDAQPAIDYHDNQIARAVLAHFLNLGQQTGTGSYALGVTFADFFTLSLQTLAQQVADVATMHIVEDLVDKNWGPEEPAPRVTFDEIGSRQQATAASIKSLVDAGILEPDEVLESSTRQQYGLPPKDPETTRGQDQGGFADALTGGQGTGQPFYAPPDTGSGSEVYASADIDDDDDDEPGQFDEMTAALAAALSEFLGQVRAAGLAEWDPSKHPRDKAGRFRTVFARVMHALEQWARGEGGDHPLRGQGFTTANLRTVATKHLGLKVRRSSQNNPVTAEELEGLILDHVRAHVRGVRDDKLDNPRPAKFTLQGGGKPDPDKVRKVELDNRVREAYRDLVRPGEWVGLADLREHPALRGLSRDEQDAALLGVIRFGDAYDVTGAKSSRLIPVANTKALKPRDRAAAVYMGDEAQHAILFGDPSPRPLPGASSNLKGLDVAVYRLPGDKPALYRENDAGKQGALVRKFDDLDEMAAWADEHGETRLAEWARKEAGGKGPEVKAPTKPTEAPANKAPLASPTPTKRTPPPPGFADDLAEEFYRNRVLTALDGIIVDSSADPRWNQRAMGVDSPAEVIGRIRQQVADGSITPEEGTRRISSLAVRFGVRDDDAIGISIGRRLGEVRKPKADLFGGDPEALRDALDLRTVPELKAMLRARGLPVSGRKRELVDRLVDAPGGKAPAEVAPKTGARAPKVSHADGLDDLRDDQLRSLAVEFEIPNAAKATRSALLRRLRQAGAVSPYRDRPSVPAIPAPTRALPDGPPVRRNWNNNPFESGWSPRQRPLADEAIYPPNGGADQGLVHMDSAMGELWMDLYGDDRVPNSFINRIAKLGESLSPRRGSASIDDDVIPQLRTLAAEAPDGGVAARIEQAVEALSAPKVTPQIPAGVPEPLARALRQLADIPTARKHGRIGASHIHAEEPTVLERKLQAVRDMIDGKFPGSGDFERELTRRDLHESGDGATQMWALFENLFQPQLVTGYRTNPSTGRVEPIEAPNPDYPAMRDWVNKMMQRARAGSGKTTLRPSGLPADRKPETGDYDDLAERISMMRPKTAESVREILNDLNAAELARLARRYQGIPASSSLLGSNRDQGLRIPAGLTTEEKRAWLAKRLSEQRHHWR